MAIYLTAGEAGQFEKAILEAVDQDGGDWQKIVERVEASGAKVSDWMRVRAVLYALVKGQVIRRFPSVHVERYERVNAAT